MVENTATANVLLDNQAVKITRWEFRPGQETGWHTHEMDYIVMPLMDGTLKIISEKQETNMVEVKTNNPYFKKAGVHHNVISANESYFAFLELEFKKEQTIE